MAKGLEDVPEPTQRVQRSLLSGQIADALRRDILIGTIRPGTRMAQQQLCEQFGVSRMPVRDALKVLVAEGLMVTDVSQHVVVAPLSRDDMTDSFHIEGLLTGLAASRASAQATTADLDHLEDLHKRMLKATREGDQSLMVELNWAFHGAINRLAGSRKIIAALKVTSLDLPRQYLGQMPGWNARSNREHAAIIKSMRAGDHDVVNAQMRDHVIGFGKGMIAFLQSRGLELA
jgi:DNA-binding GntR family transcriptional regulator